MARRWTAGLKNVLVVIVSLSCVAVTLEVATRVYSRFFFPRMMEMDDQLGWSHARNRQKTFVNEAGETILVRQNSLGLRGPEYDLSGSSNSTRVVVLGDSFTEAVQVSEGDSFSGRLQVLRPELQVLNAGVGGYSNVQEYVYLGLYGELLDPDIVLVAVYDNDLVDNCLSYYPSFGPRPYAVASTSGIEIVEELRTDDFGRFVLRLPFWNQLNQHSYFYSFLNSRVYQQFRAEEMRALNQAELRRIEACGQFEVMAGVLNLLDRRTRGLGAALRAVYIPSARDASAGLSEASDRFMAICAREGFRCLSLLEELHAAINGGTQVYFERDIHWTAAGHAVAAVAIADFLTAD